MAEETINERVHSSKYKPKLIDLNSYLDTLRLSRAERTYCERTYGSKGEKLTRKEWKSLIKFV